MNLVTDAQIIKLEHPVEVRLDQLPHTFPKGRPRVKSVRRIILGRSKRVLSRSYTYVFELSQKYGVCRLAGFNRLKHIHFNKKGRAHIDVHTKADKTHLMVVCVPAGMEFDKTFTIVHQNLKLLCEMPPINWDEPAFKPPAGPNRGILPFVDSNTGIIGSPSPQSITLQ